MILLLFFNYDHRHRQIFQMTQRKMDNSEFLLSNKFAGLAEEVQIGLAEIIIKNFHFGEIQTSAPAGAECLEERLFSGEAGGVMFGLIGLSFTIGDFLWGKDRFAEVSFAGNLPGDALNFDQINTGTVDHEN